MKPVDIIMGGSGRSGTTILGDIFRAGGFHTVLYEPRLIIGNVCLCSLLSGRCTVDDVLNSAGEISQKIMNSLHYAPRKHELAGKIGKSAIQKVALEVFEVSNDNMHKNAKAFIQALLDIARDHIGTECWCEKTPHNIKVADKALASFEEVCFVHVIRDPKEVFCSIRKFDWGPKSSDEFVIWYNDCMQDAVKCYELTDQDRYMTISLEALGENSHAVIDRAFRFANIDVSLVNIDNVAKVVHPSKCLRNMADTEMLRDEKVYIDKACSDVYGFWKNQARL